MSPFQVVALSSGEKIYIPFCPLVQITDCLDFPKPTYFVVDAVKCYSCVYIRTEGAHGIFWFNGGEAATIDKSKEIAALRAINFLIKKYGVCVGDFTMDRMRMYEKCGKLYRLKRNSMESGDKRKCCGNKVAGAVVHVALDYVGFMPRVIRKTGVLVISIETVYSAGLGYLSWLTVTCPHTRSGMECFFSELCPDSNKSKQMVANILIAEICCY
ncbi:uncharacterized protein LOC110729366 [Chenopodium quinoa]|uniref:uncharacterized protein LOC110729366 n=1 Tax=Chenopodium quinoa TaxID=63459 RepID=UPI000B7895D9|nr:uncharacterized protein LOC110729366 [Chenopodium quinoa]